MATRILYLLPPLAGTILITLPMSFVVLLWVFLSPGIGLGYEIFLVGLALFLWMGFYGSSYANAPPRQRECAAVAIMTGVVFNGFAMVVHHWIPRGQIPRIAEALSTNYGILSLILTVGAAAPLVEEALFRGYLLSRLRKQLDMRSSILVSAAAFSAVHGDSSRVAEQFLAGLMLGAIVVKTGRPWLAIPAHSACNLFGAFEVGLQMVAPAQETGLLFPIIGAAIGLGAGWMLRRVLIATEWTLWTTERTLVNADLPETAATG